MAPEKWVIEVRLTTRGKNAQVNEATARRMKSRIEEVLLRTAPFAKTEPSIILKKELLVNEPKGDWM